MSRYNTKHVTTQVRSPITTAPKPTGRTHTGGDGYARDPRSELFLLAVSYMGDDTYHENATDQYDRLVDLIRELAVGGIHDAQWCQQFLRWLRSEGNMRTASLILAAEYVKARLDAGQRGYNRFAIRSVLQRGDEPAELLAYWLHKHGRAIPKPVKRGVADAMIALGTERNYLKYDSAGKAMRWAHVLNLTHPGDRRASSQQLRGDWQHQLFGHIVAEPYANPEAVLPANLGMLAHRAELMAFPVEQRRAVLATPERLEHAGITWEALAGWLQGPMDAAAWEALIPAMGIFALTRNLRNFDEAGVSDQVADKVAARLADPEEVARSRMFPYRFLTAYLTATSDRWRHPLAKALDHATKNIPALPGRTLILIDMSGSMQSPVSGKSQMQRVTVAALFAAALAYRCGPGNVDVHGFATGVFHQPLPAGGSVLRAVETITRRIGEVGHATFTANAVKATYRGHDRLVIISDEQTQGGNPGAEVPSHIPAYTFNVSGYRYGHGPSGENNRHTLAGLTDATFRMIPLLEAGHNAAWPWENAAASNVA